MKDEQYKCQSYYDDGTLKDCTCGKCNSTPNPTGKKIEKMNKPREEKIKTHQLKIVGYFERRHIAGDPPWGNPHTIPIYGCIDCGEIHNMKDKRGYKTVITDADFKESK